MFVELIPLKGKRVNFAARSVISPDVNIEPYEIGVPPVFARKLTFPEPVTQHNFRYMRDLVIRGAHEYPGATMVEFEDGHMQYLVRSLLCQAALSLMSNVTGKAIIGTAYRHCESTVNPSGR